MSKITALTIQQKNKNRCNLFLDGEFLCGLSVEVVISERLKVGDEIDEERIREVSLLSDKKEALDKAVNYATKALKTKKQVKTYLEGKGYSPNVIFYVLDKLKEYDVINDKEYAKRYIEYKAKSQGKTLTRYNLMSRGVKKEDIEEANENVNVDYKSSARLIAEKRLKNKEITKDLIIKTYRYLFGKGFSYEEIDFALSEYREDL